MVFPRQRLYDVNHAGFAKAMLSGGLNNPGPDASEATLEAAFREAFRVYTGISDCVPLSRGRLAGYFAAKRSVQPGRAKIIMSPFTIFDLVNMVRLGGGEPHFVDTEPGSPHVSLRTIEREIDSETAAVVVTHYHSTNRQIQAIADLCRKRGVKLIEDCAISLGSRVEDAHVGTFGDFALFSFGLFKFVSTYFGGAMAVRSQADRDNIVAEVAEWPRMGARDLAPYVGKGIKISLLTQKSVFRYFTFPLFRFGYLNDLEFIKKNAQNDPDPMLRSVFPDNFKRRPSLFQLREYTRQLPLVEADRRERVKNAGRYYRALTPTNAIGLPEEPDPEIDCCLNFPIVIGQDREMFVKDMMISGFDLATHYYRNCAAIDVFTPYRRSLPNIERYVDSVVFFPVYPTVDEDYIERLTKRATALLS